MRTSKKPTSPFLDSTKEAGSALKQPKPISKDNAQTPATNAPVRKRPRPGERRVQILQALSTMLEQPGGDRITTAALAARLDVSEAALYRHFASKAQMFEALIEFIEQSVFNLIQDVFQAESEVPLQIQKMLCALLEFAEKNPGMARVMVGDALVFEHERLVARMNQFFERFEAQLLLSLKSTKSATEATAKASVISAFAMGQLQRFARSEFKRRPTEHLSVALQLLIPK
jgi:TetR/AcrR family transcriptional regulator